MKRDRGGGLRRFLAFIAILALLAGSAHLGYRLWEWRAVPPGAPLIGLSLDSSWYSSLGVTRIPYQIALTRAGARYLRFRHDDMPAREVLERIDGLLLTGGGDIHHELTGESAPGWHIVRARDEFEIALVREALKRDLPLLGICRGIQLMNVAAGGTLRDLRDRPEEAGLHGITRRSLSAHTVDLAPESILAAASPASGRRVNSFHRHAVESPGEGLIVSAAAPDGVVEGVEFPGEPFAVGVQWHPEWLQFRSAAYLGLFRALTRAAVEYRERRSSPAVRARQEITWPE